MTTTLLELLDGSRVFALRQAVVSTLKAQLPFVTVNPHPGRLDMDDVLEGTMFAPPEIRIGVARVVEADDRMSGHRDVPVDLVAYVITADQAFETRGLVTRDELGLALCDGLLAIVEDPSLSRWDLADISPADGANAQPLFTSIAKDRGTAFYAVAWRQVLTTLGRPFMDWDTKVTGPPPAARFLAIGEPWDDGAP